MPKRSFAKFTKRLEAIKLRAPIEKRAIALHVTLQDLYEGPRADSTVAARKDVYAWLGREGLSVQEIARLFDRAPNGVWKLMGGA